jgi:hypothetical protein
MTFSLGREAIKEIVRYMSCVTEYLLEGADITSMEGAGALDIQARVKGHQITTPYRTAKRDPAPISQ